MTSRLEGLCGLKLMVSSWASNHHLVHCFQGLNSSLVGPPGTIGGWKTANNDNKLWDMKTKSDLRGLASRTWGVTLIRMLWSGKGLIGTAGPAAYFLLPEIFQTL